MPVLRVYVNEDALRKARKRASAKRRGLTALVRDYLQRPASEEALTPATVAKDLTRAFETADVVVGPRGWTRDELHDRERPNRRHRSRAYFGGTRRGGDYALHSAIDRDNGDRPGADYYSGAPIR